MKNRPNLPRRRLKRLRRFNDEEDDDRTEYAELCPGETEIPTPGAVR
jgi:hypothetical protein